MGNISGVCPECGEPLVAAFLPPWQRTGVALATALLAAMITEYAVQQFSLQHRVALLFIQWFRSDGAAWLVTALVRGLPVAGCPLGAYLYLDPKRFPEQKA